MLFTRLRRRSQPIPAAPQAPSQTAEQPQGRNRAERKAGGADVGSIAADLCQSTCPACGHHVAVEFYAGGWHPLTTLAWPRSTKQAEAMPKLPHHFVRCVDCGHVYNADFDYANVPYSDKPNLMFNRGEIWSQHLEQVRQLLTDNLASEATVVEIGCGDGSLLNAIAAARPGTRCIGFDPNSQIDSGGGRVETRTELFLPEVHLDEYRPDLIISRHVLEHLLNPLGFIQQLAFAVSWHDAPTRLFIEVPCVDQVMSAGRTVDFFYEHNSHFTTQSLQRMLQRCSSQVGLIDTSYNGEVVYALADFRRHAPHVQHAKQSLAFRNRAATAQQRLAGEFERLLSGSRSVAIWGGTGKAAAFINQNSLDRIRFPLVVDSDANKVGTYVPGAGQRILSPDALSERYIDTILVATQWRASDIVLEIQQRGIRCERVLLEFDGRLVDYHRDAHPYRLEETSDAAPHGPHVTGPAAPHVSLAGAGLPLLPNSDSPAER